MKLFSYEGYQLKISDEAYAIKAFRDIVKRDRSRNKDRALIEFSLIYFYLDPRSDYAYILDDEERLSKIKEHEGLPESWEPDDKVKRAMEVYKTLTQTTLSIMLKDSQIALEKAREFLKNLDLTEVDDKGKPKYTLSSHFQALKMIPQLMKEYKEIEKLVSQDVEEHSKMRANRVKTITDDGFSRLFQSQVSNNDSD